MENNKFAALQEKRDELIEAINDKRNEMDCFDVSEYYDEDMFIEDMSEEFGTVKIMGHVYYAIDTLRKIDNNAFREVFNNHLDTLDKGWFDEYKELDEELEELESELAEIEDEIEQLENE